MNRRDVESRPERNSVKDLADLAERWLKTHVYPENIWKALTERHITDHGERIKMKRAIDKEMRRRETESAPVETPPEPPKPAEPMFTDEQRQLLEDDRRKQMALKHKQMIEDARELALKYDPKEDEEEAA